MLFFQSNIDNCIIKFIYLLHKVRTRPPPQHPSWVGGEGESRLRPHLVPSPPPPHSTNYFLILRMGIAQRTWPMKSARLRSFKDRRILRTRTTKKKWTKLNNMTRRRILTTLDQRGYYFENLNLKKNGYNDASKSWRKRFEKKAIQLKKTFDEKMFHRKFWKTPAIGSKRRKKFPMAEHLDGDRTILYSRFYRLLSHSRNWLIRLNWFSLYSSSRWLSPWLPS